MRVFIDPAGATEAPWREAREVRVEAAAVDDPTTGCTVYLDDLPNGALRISVQRGDATLERIAVRGRAARVRMDVITVEPTTEAVAQAQAGR